MYKVVQKMRAGTNKQTKNNSAERKDGIFRADRKGHATQERVYHACIHIPFKPPHGMSESDNQSRLAKIAANDAQRFPRKVSRTLESSNSICISGGQFLIESAHQIGWFAIVEIANLAIPSLFIIFTCREGEEVVTQTQKNVR
jgi:hypothetical protein